MGLSGRLSHQPAQLSGGERQRVAVCRALINQPLLLLADEPTGNLDRTTAEHVGALLLDLNREQRTMLICVTHSTELCRSFPDDSSSSMAHCTSPDRKPGILRPVSDPLPYARG